ncbi:MULTISPECIES: hypothetical protein [unclassified Mycobacterium]|uniref:hypothetical protein n=1 Tax=unclassified Mycobacterium TaxID=2642494 RepID=UPI0029C825F8|nr:MULTISPECIES: hypothetical protein [unclassified Mycobacterium]
MNVASFVRSLLSRPIACAAIMVLAIAAGVAGTLSAPHTYQSTAVIVVIPPGSGNPDAMMNPLVNLTTNMAQLAAVVATKMRTDGGAVATAAGGTGEFTVDTTFGDSPTFAQLTSQLVIEAKASNAVAAQRTTQALTDFASTALQKLQADSWVPSHNNAVIVASVAPQPGAAVSSSPIRSGAAYAFAVLLLGVISLILYDVVRGRLRSTKPNSSKHVRATNGHPIEESRLWPDDEATMITPLPPSATELHPTAQ